MERTRNETPALEAMEHLALEVWRGHRAVDALALSGLNSERAIRDRLETFRLAFIRSPQGQRDEPVRSAVRRVPLEEVDFARHPTHLIRQRIEALVEGCFPGRVAGPDALFGVEDLVPRFAVRCFLVVSLGARLGWWTARGVEVRDARIAKALYGELRLVRWTQYRGLIEASEELYRTARWRESARSALEADRLVRTTAALLRASAALTKSGEFASALWCVRAALLEPRATFESLGVAERARNLEARLALLVESPSPSRAAEAERLAREEPILLRDSKGARDGIDTRARDDQDAKAALLSVAGTPELAHTRDPRRAPTLIESSRKKRPVQPEPRLYAPARRSSVLEHPIVADLQLGLTLRRPELAGRARGSSPQELGGSGAPDIPRAPRRATGDDEPTEAIIPTLPKVAPRASPAHEETERIRDRARG